MIDFTVKPDGGDEYKVTATSRDILQWEKSTKGASFRALQLDMRWVDLYKLAHLASRRQGMFTGTLQEFEQACELVNGEESEEQDPSHPAR